MSRVEKLQRLWRYGRPYRRAFGAVAGSRLAWEVAEAEYRRPAGELVPVRVPGWSQPVLLRARSSDVEVFRQLLLDAEFRLPLSPPPTRILDGGANIGLASLLFARWWPAAKIVGVELEPRNVELARRNCAHLPNVRIVHGALWGSSGSVEVANPDADAHSFRADLSREHGEIRAYRISELLDEVGWERVDLVKLDIEGAERVVLGDHAGWLPRVQHLLIELHDRFEPGCTEAFDAAVAPTAWSIQQLGEYLLASRRSG